MNAWFVQNAIIKEGRVYSTPNLVTKQHVLKNTVIFYDAPGNNKALLLPVYDPHRHAISYYIIAGPMDMDLTEYLGEIKNLLMKGNYLEKLKGEFSSGVFFFEKRDMQKRLKRVRDDCYYKSTKNAVLYLKQMHTNDDVSNDSMNMKVIILEQY